MTAIHIRVQPGEQIEVVTRADGIQPATVQAVANGHVMLIYQRPFLVNNKGEKSTWQWVTLAQLGGMVVSS